ncbi:MAG: hypothetical protein V4548_02775 [Bacteroidota bacterium]
MKNLFLIIYLIFYSSLFAQDLHTTKVLSISDSILFSKVDIKLKKYFKVSEGSYYKYSVSNKSKTRKFLSRNKLKKTTIEIWVLYSFNYTEIDGIISGVWVKLDKNLKLIEPLNLNFIPDFIINNKKSNFIEKNIVTEIAFKSFSKKGIEVTEPKLHFIGKFEKYTYSIYNKTTKFKNSNGKDAGKMEILEIDAITGEILEKSDGYYGLMMIR